MALQVDLSTPFGTVSNAYVRIVSFEGDKDKVTLKVGCYFSQDARLHGAEPVLETTHTVDFADGNLLVVAYEFLKTQVYVGAIDA